MKKKVILARHAQLKRHYLMIRNLPIKLLTNTFLLLFFLLLLLPSKKLWSQQTADLTVPDGYYDIYHPTISRKGMVVSQSTIASEIGADILRQGGNAVDAAVAVGFALSVVLPRAGNLGGGGFMLIHLAENNKTTAINYREMAPAAAYREIFLNKDDQPDMHKSLYTAAAAGVPGTVAGLHYALKKYGSMSWSDIIKPAEIIARQGFVVDDDMVEKIKKEEASLKKNPETCRVYFKSGCEAYKVGEILVQHDLANTLAYLRKQGANGFYKGKIAHQIVAAMKAGEGLITLQDLAEYKVQELEPIRGYFNGYEVLTMPPPSSGGVHLIQMLNMLEALPHHNIAHGSATMMHLQAEIFKRAYADRATYLGDTNFVDVPIEGLISKDYARQLVKGIKTDTVTPSSDIKEGDPAKYESPDTTHFSIMDQAGNVVSNTYTLNHNFGSGITIPGGGFFINNTMDDFSAKPGSPNSYGLMGGESNAIAPKKRPLSSMTPTIVLKNGKPFIATGTPGGSKIITAVFQQLVNVLLFDMNISEATNAVRIHHQWLPDILYVEQEIPPDALDKLKKLGYNIEVSNPLGSLQSIMRKNNIFLGAADPRRPGAKAVAVK